MSSATHEDDARFFSNGDKGVGDARRAVDKIPLPQKVFLTFNDGDAGAGEDQEVFLVVKLAMILRPR